MIAIQRHKKKRKTCLSAMHAASASYPQLVTRQPIQLRRGRTINKHSKAFRAKYTDHSDTEAANITRCFTFKHNQCYDFNLREGLLLIYY